MEGYDPAQGPLSVSLNGGEPLNLTADGPFTFPVKVQAKRPFAVTFAATPLEQACTLEGAEGIIEASAVDSTRVRCITRSYSLGGSAQGLDRDGLALNERFSAQRATVAADAGAFSFPNPVPFGQAYAVSLDTMPVGRECSLAAATGVVAGPVTSLAVTCAPRRVVLGLDLAGVDADGLALEETRSGQVLTLASGASTAEFPAALAWESTYDVRVTTAPLGRACAVDGGVGVVLGTTTRPQVACTRQRFTVGGSVSGLDGGGLVLFEAATQQQTAPASGATGFQFPAPIEWDTAISVGITGQPTMQFCTLDGGARLVRSNITDLDIACRRGAPVSGLVRNLRGTGLLLAERGTNQTVSISPDGGVVGFQFPFVVPEGDLLELVVTTQPAGQTCRVEAPSAPVAGPVGSVLLTCGPSTNDLVINEVGSVAAATAPLWVELYNGTPAPIALGDYALRSASRVVADGGAGPLVDFNLPDASIPSGSYLVVSGKPFADLYDAPQQRFLEQAGLTPVPGANLELRARDAGVDALVFDGGPLTGPMDFGRSLARVQAPDSDTANDFAACDFPTPAGLNDVCNSPDVDLDGLPDVAEVSGGTWNEQPLFDWGARTGQRDLFVELDWLDPTGYSGAFDPGVLPRREALERIEQVYRAHGLHVHFDSGALFHPAAGLSPSDFDLGGGNQAPWACTITLSNVPGATSLYRVKAAHNDLRRRLSFHYALFAGALADVTCANAGQGGSGNAELGGNDLVVALGRLNLTLTPQQNLNRTINFQSSTLMHELGHNLGLRHGGFEDANYKPNYLSIMNYYYQFDGLPVLGMNEGDRYFREYVLYGACSGAPGITSSAGLNRNRFSAPSLFALDYSDGSSVALDETSLVEANGFGRPGSGPVDFNWNTVIDAAPVSANLNALNTIPRACPRVSPGNEVLLDHDDWAALSLPFSRTQRGSSGKMRAPLKDFFDDHQPIAEETPLPQ